MKMPRPSSLTALGLLLLPSVTGSVLRPRDQIVFQHSDASNSPPRALIDDFISQQTSIAWESLRCNIGPGDCVPGAAPGVVVASPDRVDPPYFFTWTRDSALVMKYITDAFLINLDSDLEHLVRSYAETQAKLQPVTNPSGSLWDGAGLGEAKFKVNLRPFLENWGRPQRDGPALRAITIIGYAKYLVEIGQAVTAREFLWPIIRNDLSYVGQYWNETGFDLWEEVRGSSFFTTAAQHRALVEGADLAKQLGVHCAACTEIAPQILCFLDSYWSEKEGYALANMNHHHRRSGKDINTILTSIHNFDPALDCDAATFQPCSDRALSNHKVVTDSFRSSVYPINENVPQGQAVAVGRYPEDVYYAGNPWYLATSAAAEQLYDALMAWEKRGSIPVTSVSLAFFRDLVPEIEVGTYNAGTTMYGRVYAAVFDYADGYMDVVRRYTPQNGSLSEQFAKLGGEPLSAHDLTWSYAAFLTAVARRAKVLPRSWGTPSASNMPEKCSSRTMRGHYAAPSRTVFPLPPGATAEPAPTSPPCSATPLEVPVAFHEVVETNWGETVKLVGNVGTLGNWNVDLAPALDPSEYSTEYPIWKIEADLPWGEVIEYKFVKVDPQGHVTWEQDPNHTLVIPEAPCPVETGLVEDRWRGH
jgi:glucoamylase